MVIVEEEIAASQDCRFFCIQEIFLTIVMSKINYFLILQILGKGKRTKIALALALMCDRRTKKLASF